MSLTCHEEIGRVGEDVTRKLLAWMEACELYLRVANSGLEVVEFGGAQLSVVVAIELFDEMFRFDTIISQLRLENICRLRQADGPDGFTHVQCEIIA